MKIILLNHGKFLPSRVGMFTGRYAHTDGFRTVNVTNLLLENNPQEMNNLWGNPSYNTVIIELQQKLIEWNLRTYTEIDQGRILLTRK